MSPVPFIQKTFSFEVGTWLIEPTYWQAFAIVFLIFLLILTLARLRHLYVHWSVSKPAVSFIFYGFLLALVVEGFLIISGRTLFTEILGWKNAPKPVSTILDAGRVKLVKVLGVTEQVPESYAKNPPTYQGISEDFENLSSQDKELVKSYICKP